MASAGVVTHQQVLLFTKTIDAHKGQQTAFRVALLGVVLGCVLHTVMCRLPGYCVSGLPAIQARFMAVVAVMGAGGEMFTGS